MAIDSEELLQVSAEAEDIARNVSQRLSTAHLLLAIFTLDNDADRLLRERGVSEDEVLALLTKTGKTPEEPEGLTVQALARARQIADDCGHASTDAMHLLVALSRLSKSAAAILLDRAAAPLNTLRTMALARLTSPLRRRSPAREGVRDEAKLERSDRQENPRPPSVREPARAAIGAGAGLPRNPPSALGSVPQPAVSHGPRTAVTEAPPSHGLAGAGLAALSANAAHELSRDGRSGLFGAPDLRELRDPRDPRDDAAPRHSRLGASQIRSADSRGPELRSAGPDAAGARFALDPQKFPWLATHGRNLSQLAAAGLLDAAIGRESEVDELLDILGKRRANNPVLVGEPGVGKTAIVEGLALRLAELAQTAATSHGNPPAGNATARSASEASPFDRIVIELDIGGLVAGTALRGSFSERLLGIKDDVKRADGRVIVFIDELHMLIGAGSTGEGPQDAANELKAALARGEFPCIGATTHDEFRKHIQGDPALERRFVPVLVREPSPRQALRILEGAAPRYQAHHAVHFSADALEAACRMTARYVRDRFLPDKAFAAIDLAGSRARREGKSEVDHDDVARAVARMAGLPEERLLQPDGERFLTLERRLSERIVGHERALSALARVLRRNCAGFAGQRPLASLLFVGPSGVGKTETAKVLAEELFPSADSGGASLAARSGALVRLDLSEFSEPHSVSRLVGAAPGYVGYGEGGLLTEPVRRNPACVILLDEAEKAHPAVLQLLLQVLDEGQLTDGRGRRVDFTAAVIVLTSNAGAAAFGGGGRPAGFAAQPKESPEAASADVDALALTLPPEPSEHPQAARSLELARASFAPEIWSRFDERMVFAPLSREQVARVAQLLLTESSRRLWEERRIAFRTGPGLVDALVQGGGFLPALGARPMRQAIERMVESPLADEILAGRVKSGDRLLALAGARGIEFRKEAP